MIVMCLGDFNGHVGRHVEGVHGGYGVGNQRNFTRVLSVEGIMCVKYMVYERGKEEGDIENG